MRLVDLSNKHFGRLTVFERSDSNDAQNKPMWVCQCECFAWVTVRGSDLKRGNVQSCGCLLIENRKRIKHGQSRQKHISSEYTTWQGMKRRCLDPNNKCYHRYGGRGIKVCERWMHSFENFLADMGERPFPKATLDRKKNNEDYSKSNCKWSTATEQAQNKSNTIYVDYKGKSMSVHEVALLVGISSNTICKRLRRGWSLERALNQPIKRYVALQCVGVRKAK